MLRKAISLCTLIACASLSSCSDNDQVSGCTDANACNYNSLATDNDGSCTFICLTETEKTRVINFVDSAIAFIQDQGEDSAFAVFDDPGGQFVDNEMYIVVMDDSATILSHGFQPNLIGTNTYNLQDIHGKYFVHDIVDIIQSPEGKGWVWYYWNNPATNAINKKFAYIKRHGAISVLSGTYK